MRVKYYELRSGIAYPGEWGAKSPTEQKSAKILGFETGKLYVEAIDSQNQFGTRTFHALGKAGDAQTSRRKGKREKSRGSSKARTERSRRERE